MSDSDSNTDCNFGFASDLEFYTDEMKDVKEKCKIKKNCLKVNKVT